MTRRDRLGSVQDEGRVTSCRRILSSRLLQRPAVVGVKTCGVRSVAVVRLLQGPIAHGSTCGEGGGKILPPLGDRSDVLWETCLDGSPGLQFALLLAGVANCWIQLST
jgi:hypothetical protein